MKYLDFYQKLKNSYPVLTRADIGKLTGGAVLDVQLSEWARKDLLVKPRKNIYLLKDNENINPFILANRLFEPSYISLESALFYYNLIPDVVAAATSITSKKSRRFDFNGQLYNYQKIKSNLFWGYTEVKENKWGFLIACPEKAVLDYFYLNLPRLKNENSWDELRIEVEAYKKAVNRAKLLKFLKIFNSENLAKVIKQFDNHIRN